jgi:hypothetical protein
MVASHAATQVVDGHDGTEVVSGPLAAGVTFLALNPDDK